jgi:hypothetical protein
MRGGWNRGGCLQVSIQPPSQPGRRRRRFVCSSRRCQETLNVAAQKVLRPIRHITHPIPDMGVLDQEGYDRIIACIQGEMDAGRTVYVHCWGGKGRTGTVVGCLLIDGGLDYDGAIKRIPELRAGTRKANEPCPESSAQHRVPAGASGSDGARVVHVPRSTPGSVGRVPT